MGTGKRASMREGPLAALFRKTEAEAEAQAAGSGARSWWTSATKSVSFSVRAARASAAIHARRSSG